MDRIEEKVANSSRELGMTVKMEMKKEEIHKMMKKIKNKYIKFKINKNSFLNDNTHRELDNSDIKKKKTKKKSKKKQGPPRNNSSNYVQLMLDLSDNMNCSISKVKEQIQSTVKERQEDEKMILKDIYKPQL